MLKKIFLIFLFLPFIILPQDVILKSMQVYTGKDQINVPVLFRGGNLNIEFDVEAEHSPNLSIYFRFCDREWNIYDDISINNPLRNIDENIWFDHLPASVFRAQYHFKGSYPNKEIKFPFSGKWKFIITDSYDKKNVYAVGKFIVVSQSQNLDVSLKRETINRNQHQSKVYDRAYKLTTSFTLPDSLFPFSVLGIDILENHRIDDMIFLDKRNDEYRYFEWNGSDKFSFVIRDLMPGNHYRQTNLMNTLRHAPPSTTAHLDGLETSNFYAQTRPDYFGGSRIVLFDRDESRYMDVLFELRAPEELDKNVFLVGSFNNWQLLPEYEMSNDNGLHSISIELKRGIYDYQYVAAYKNRYRIYDDDWLILEGNEYSTNRQYYVFLYYKSEDYGGYDKIIGVKRILSKHYD